LEVPPYAERVLGEVPDKDRYPGPPGWEFSARVKSTPHQNLSKRGKLWPEYGPKGHRGRGIIVINNSIAYDLCAGTTKPDLMNKQNGMASITTGPRPIIQTAQKHKENTRNTSRKRVNKKSHLIITVKIIL
jgi:hypothetical protein